MYKIRACRMGTIRNGRYHANLKAKGPFYLCADTIEELVKKMYNAYPSLFYPTIRTDLQPEEFKLLNKKYRALACKRGQGPDKRL